MGRELSILVVRQDQALVAPGLLRLDQTLDQHLPASDDRPVQLQEVNDPHRGELRPIGLGRI
jgi:CubicO group peptidase (beta-lactamase class C family)